LFERVDGLITFLYYKDLEKAASFYQKTMGFELVIDQSWAKIYKVTDRAHIGIVDEKRGYHKASSAKPVMVTLVVPNVDAWHRYLKHKGAKLLTEPHDIRELGIRAFLLEDPEGYVLEIQRFF